MSVENETLHGALLQSDVEADIDVIIWSIRLEKLRRYRKQRFWELENRDAEYADRIEVFPRLETVAEHSWHVADIILILATHFQELNAARCLELAILHDKMEIVTGDENPLGRDGTGTSTHAFNSTMQMKKEDSERAAVEYYVAMLRPTLRDHQRAAFFELLEAATNEARFVKAVDKLQALVYVILKKRGDFHDKHLEFTLRYSGKMVTYFPRLAQHYDTLRARLIREVCAFRQVTPDDLWNQISGGQLGLFVEAL